MNNKLKIMLVTIVSIISLIIVDSLQALIFNNKPYLSIKKYYNGGDLNYINKGLFVDTYTCINGKRDSVIKGSSYSCSITDDYIIVDTSKDIKDFVCAEALEKIYSKDHYTFYLNCIKSKYIEVRYKNGKKENIKEALEKSKINIEDLDKFNIDYIKYDNNVYDFEEPEDISMVIKEGTLTKNSATIIITDLSGKENIYGGQYRIDKKINGKWQEVDIIPSDYARVWLAIGYFVDENNKLELEHNWEHLYGELECGEYRIVKSTNEIGDETEIYFSVEFIIE